jgi:hypothetical protein
MFLHGFSGPLVLRVRLVHLQTTARSRLWTLVVLRLQLPKLDGNVVKDGGGHDDELVIL